MIWLVAAAWGLLGVHLMGALWFWMKYRDDRTLRPSYWRMIATLAKRFEWAVFGFFIFTMLLMVWTDPIWGLLFGLTVLLPVGLWGTTYWAVCTLLAKRAARREVATQ